MYFVYVLKSEKDRKLYYGFTKDLVKRLNQHNAGMVTSTRSRIPFKLIYSEPAGSMRDARKKEKYFKSGFGRKYIQSKIKE